MRILSVLLILAGVLVLATPTFLEWKADSAQAALLQEAEQLLMQQQETRQAELASGMAKLSQVLDAELARSEEDVRHGQNGTEAADDAAEVAPPAVQVPDAPASPTATALIEIAAIGVKLPILEGATQTNMKSAAARMTETSPFGEIGNSAVAAHRARTKGRLFNRLDEVKEGDNIVIKTGGKTYTYTVYDSYLVEPTDVSVLEPSESDSILTLITCDPVVNATHRLIVQAKLKSDS